MLDAHTEINRLRQKLRMKNMSETVIDSICNDVAVEISNATADLLADAMIQATELGADAKSLDFIEQVQAVRFGSQFNIGTRSGRTDFSEPPFPMLPKLLKNAKTAKDGSKYKVIPIKQKTVSKTQIATNDAIDSINNARLVAKEERSRSTTNPLQGMETVAALAAINSQRKSAVSQDVSGPVTFRTASSKQDASTKWVHPGRKADMTGPLHNLNMNLGLDIDKLIHDIIRKYEDSF